MSSAPDCRLIIEPTDPKNRHFSQPPLPFATSLGPGEGNPRLERHFDATFAGTVQSPATEARNHARLPARQVVKDITTSNLLPWLVHRYPEVPVISLLRRPFAAAWSLLELGWRRDPLSGLLRKMSLGTHQGDFDQTLAREGFLSNVTL